MSHELTTTFEPLDFKRDKMGLRAYSVIKGDMVIVEIYDIVATVPPTTEKRSMKCLSIRWRNEVRLFSAKIEFELITLANQICFGFSQ